MTSSALFFAVFVACVVEAVEALTIVLAAGKSRDWRSAIAGVVAALVCLAVVVAVMGTTLGRLPLDQLRLFVGGLLLVFGLQWLRKAILRASGHKALHDEQAAFEATARDAHTADSRRRGVVTDWYAFTLSFKGVVLEGLEVAFIAVTFGSTQHDLPVAVAAAVTAAALVTVIGVVVRAPLARVPENSMKFVVGVTLTAFGLFWSVEGAGAHWPGGDLALPVLFAGVALYALALVAWFRRTAPAGMPEPVR